MKTTLNGFAATVLAIGLAASIAAPTYANGKTTIASTLGPSGQFDANGAQDVTGTNTVVSYVEVAGGFTVTGGNYTLDQIGLGLGSFPGSNDAAIISLQTASNTGEPSGTILESWNVSGLPSFASGDTLTTVTSILHPLLNDGQSYWVVVGPGDPSTDFGFDNDYLDQNGLDGIFHYGSWSTANTLGRAFDVIGTPATSDVTATPEPASFTSLGLMLIGGVGALALRKRKPAATS